MPDAILLCRRRIVPAENRRILIGGHIHQTPSWWSIRALPAASEGSEPDDRWQDGNMHMLSARGGILWHSGKTRHENAPGVGSSISVSLVIFQTSALPLRWRSEWLPVLSGQARRMQQSSAGDWFSSHAEFGPPYPHPFPKIRFGEH